MAFFMRPKRQRQEDESRPFRNKIAELSELPKDVALGMPILTVTGQMELCLENYRGILEYTDSLVRIQTRTGQIRITGQKLEVVYYTNDEMKVNGHIHSIEYQRLEAHFYVFAVRCMDKWLSWEEVKFYATLFDLPTVPELVIEPVSGLMPELLKQEIINMSQEPSVFGSCDPWTKETCTREGVVSRNIEEYPVSEFMHNVFKYVRKGHVKTDEHWTRNWKRARLTWEFTNEKEK